MVTSIPVWKIVLACILAVILSVAVSLTVLSVEPGLNSTVLSAIAGGVLALLFQYVTGFQGWYNELNDENQKKLMLGLLTLSGLSIFGLSCFGLLAEFVPEIILTCDTSGILSLVIMVGTAVTANQSVHRILPKK